MSPCKNTPCTQCGKTVWICHPSECQNQDHFEGIELTDAIWFCSTACEDLSTRDDPPKETLTIWKTISGRSTFTFGDPTDGPEGGILSKDRTFKLYGCMVDWLDGPEASTHRQEVRVSLERTEDELVIRLQSIKE